MRILARPPRLELTSSFAEAHSSQRFAQLELIDQEKLAREARKQGLSLSEALLEELDRVGAFRPIAFAGRNWHGYPLGSHWNPEALTFREDVAFRKWGGYRFREHGRRRVLALYSPWQLMYLKSAAVEERLVPFSLPLLTGRRNRLMQAAESYRSVAWIHRKGWAALEEHWRPVVLLLVWLQNRYLPFVRGRTTYVGDPRTLEPVDPLPAEIRRFKPRSLLRKLGIGADDVLNVYKQLALIGKTRDPIHDWYLVVRAAPHQAHERFEGDALLAQIIYDAAEVLRRYLLDLTGEVPPDCDEVFGWPEDWKDRFLGHERRIHYDRDDFKRILERKRLTPFGVHVFVEGDSDKELLGGLIDATWGDHRKLGVRFTVLGGIGELKRHRALVEAFSTYARKALLVADDEGKVQRDLERLRADGLLVDEDSFHPWKRNIEEDSSTLKELVDIAREIALGRGQKLALSVAKLRRIQQAAGLRKGATSLIVDYARQCEVRISKVEIAVALRERILEELRRDADEEEVVSRRPVLGLALAIGRYSAS